MEKSIYRRVESVIKNRDREKNVNHLNWSTAILKKTEVTERDAAVWLYKNLILHRLDRYFRVLLPDD